MRRALLVIDMQNDYLCKTRQQQFTYDTAHLVSSVNSLIHKQQHEGQDVIYIRHIICDLPTNRLLFGYSIAGTEGAKLYDGLEIVSDARFDKYLPDALSNRALVRLIREEGYDTLLLCGLDECGCVAATALGAARRGIKATIMREATATICTEKKVAATRRKLNAAGIRYE